MDRQAVGAKTEGWQSKARAKRGGNADSKIPRVAVAALSRIMSDESGIEEIGAAALTSSIPLSSHIVLISADVAPENRQNVEY